MIIVNGRPRGVLTVEVDYVDPINILKTSGCRSSIFGKLPRYGYSCTGFARFMAIFENWKIDYAESLQRSDGLDSSTVAANKCKLKKALKRFVSANIFIIKLSRLLVKIDA